MKMIFPAMISFISTIVRNCPRVTAPDPPGSYNTLPKDSIKNKNVPLASGILCIIFFNLLDLDNPTDQNLNTSHSIHKIRNC